MAKKVEAVLAGDAEADGFGATAADLLARIGDDDGLPALSGSTGPARGPRQPGSSLPRPRPHRRTAGIMPQDGRHWGREPVLGRWSGARRRRQRRTPDQCWSYRFRLLSFVDAGAFYPGLAGSPPMPPPCGFCRATLPAGPAPLWRAMFAAPDTGDYTCRRTSWRAALSQPPACDRTGGPRQRPRAIGLQRSRRTMSPPVRWPGCS